MRISDWSSDVCSSDLAFGADPRDAVQRRIRDVVEIAVQSFVKLERELTHVSLFAQAAYALQAFLDQQVVVIVAGVIEIPDVGAFEPIEIVRDFAPADRKSTRLNSSH